MFMSKKRLTIHDQPCNSCLSYRSKFLELENLNKKLLEEYSELRTNSHKVLEFYMRLRSQLERFAKKENCQGIMLEEECLNNFENETIQILRKENKMIEDKLLKVQNYNKHLQEEINEISIAQLEADKYKFQIQVLKDEIEVKNRTINILNQEIREKNKRKRLGERLSMPNIIKSDIHTHCKGAVPSDRENSLDSSNALSNNHVTDKYTHGDVDEWICLFDKMYFKYILDNIDIDSTEKILDSIENRSLLPFELRIVLILQLTESFGNEYSNMMVECMLYSLKKQIFNDNKSKNHQTSSLITLKILLVFLEYLQSSNRNEALSDNLESFIVDLIMNSYKLQNRKLFLKMIKLVSKFMLLENTEHAAYHTLSMNNMVHKCVMYIMSHRDIDSVGLCPESKIEIENELKHCFTCEEQEGVSAFACFVFIKSVCSYYGWLKSYNTIVKILLGIMMTKASIMGNPSKYMTITVLLRYIMEIIDIGMFEYSYGETSANTKNPIRRSFLELSAKVKAIYDMCNHQPVLIGAFTIFRKKLDDFLLDTNTCM